MAYPEVGADLGVPGGPRPLGEALGIGLELLDVLVAQARGGRPHLGLAPEVCFYDGSRLRVGGLEAAMPEEAYAGFRPADQRGRTGGGTACVVYAAGGLLYYLLTGDRPPGPGASPSAANPAVPGWIDRVVTMATQADPNHRYDTLKTFRAAIGAARAAVELRDRSPRTAAPSGSETPPPRPAPGPMHPLGRRRAGGLRPLPAYAFEGSEAAPPLQDAAGMGGHPEAIDAGFPETEGPPPEPEYRFSWRVTLTRGVPILCAFALCAAWFVMWVRSLLG